jgi:hypothetical protein
VSSRGSTILRTQTRELKRARKRKLWPPGARGVHVKKGEMSSESAEIRGKGGSVKVSIDVAASPQPGWRLWGCGHWPRGEAGKRGSGPGVTQAKRVVNPNH